MVVVREEVAAVTMTCDQAAERHPGDDGHLNRVKYFRRICLRGAYLAKRHGGWSKVPEKEKCTALNAKKVGKYWFIPVVELDRVFLGKTPE